MRKRRRDGVLTAVAAAAFCILVSVADHRTVVSDPVLNEDEQAVDTPSSDEAEMTALLEAEDRSFLAYTMVPEIKLQFDPLTTSPPNWVGPSIGDFTDSACYRKIHRHDSNGECPRGFAKNAGWCSSQCPMAYPVQCIAECVPQNDDCVLDIMAKVTNPGYVVLNIATAGVFNALHKTAKHIKHGVMCAFNVFNIAEGISRFLRTRQLLTPNSTKEELLAAAYQTDLFLVDLPVAITTCMDDKVHRFAFFADAVVTAAETLVKQLVLNRNAIMSSADAFLAFFRNTTAGKSARDLDAESVANLTSLINSGSSCGSNLKRLTDRVIVKIADIRDSNPSASKADIRREVGSTSIMLDDVPAITNECMGELLKTKKPYVAYQTRDTLRKIFGVIVEQLIKTSTTDMGKAMARKDYLVKTSNLGLQGLSAIDPTGIAYMTFNYVQPMCGPTEFVGEIDDGSLTDALGLTTMDNAFRGSEGTWTKKGDGLVRITFISTDTKTVKVVIHSGGKKVDSVHVKSGRTVIWTSTVQELADKTMYLDRWRPGVLGIPGSSGGSLLLWVSRSSEGGHLEMTVKINAT
ncbi:unnamed protein product [Hyaloperonospora brassicae]|uniref:RxLR effector candidate protein n=1 Tax=Hyaloperonospora brassicae TaxID=162125 RepID=A0AAV0UGK6_HYABA|nr:unnamed protein product [Hyaloperonospora brassicae]